VKIQPQWVVTPGKQTTTIVFNISNIDKEINKELPENDLIEDRNMLERFLKCFK
jgi:hypothetical protein